MQPHPAASAPGRATPRPQAVLPHLSNEDIRSARLTCQNWRLAFGHHAVALRIPLDAMSGRAAKMQLKKAAKVFPNAAHVTLHHERGWCDPVQVGGRGTARGGHGSPQRQAATRMPPAGQFVGARGAPRMTCHPVTRPAPTPRRHRPCHGCRRAWTWSRWCAWTLPASVWTRWAPWGG